MTKRSAEERSADCGLLAVKDCCVELTKLLEAIAAADDDDDSLEAAMEEFWEAEERICRRVMTLLPDEFPDGHLPRAERSNA